MTSGALLEPSSGKWADALVHLKHDVYHVPRYVELASTQEHGKPVAYFATQGDAYFLVPLILRELPQSLQSSVAGRDAISPYGYASPIISDGISESQAASFIDALVQDLRDAGLVTLFLR